MPKTQLPSFEHLRDIHLKWVRLYTRIMFQSGLTLPKYSLLSQLVRSGALSMTDASEKLYISKPCLTNLVKRMTQEKLIKKTDHPEDHRSSLLEVLPKGQKTVVKAQTDLLNFIFEALKSLPDSDKVIIDKFFLHLSCFMDGALGQSKKVKMSKC